MADATLIKFTTPEPLLTLPVASRAATARQSLWIRPASNWKAVDFRELWRCRGLLWFLALCDIQVRYKQTFLGAAWAVLQPLTMMVVFSIFFGYLGGMGTHLDGRAPYPVYVFCGLLPWQLFAFGLMQSSVSVVANRGLITKVYFPRLLVPLAPLLCGLLDFSISLAVLAALMSWYGLVPGWAVLTLPLFILLGMATALAVGLWLASLNARYRDVQHTLPLLTQLWLFLTPVVYPAGIVPNAWRWLYQLNPMVGVVEGFRWALLGGTVPPLLALAMSVVTVAVLLVGGLYYFRRTESAFADLL